MGEPAALLQQLTQSGGEGVGGGVWCGATVCSVFQSVQGSMVCFRVYRGVWCVSECTGEYGVFQSVQGSMVCFRVYRGVWCVSECTGEYGVFRSVVYRVGMGEVERWPEQS